MGCRKTDMRRTLPAPLPGCMDHWADDPGVIPPAHIRQPAWLKIFQCAKSQARSAPTTIAVGEHSEPTKRKRKGPAAERRHSPRGLRAELLRRYAARTPVGPIRGFLVPRHPRLFLFRRSAPKPTVARNLATRKKGISNPTASLQLRENMPIYPYARSAEMLTFAKRADNSVTSNAES